MVPVAVVSLGHARSVLQARAAKIIQINISKLKYLHYVGIESVFLHPKSPYGHETLPYRPATGVEHLFERAGGGGRHAQGAGLRIAGNGIGQATRSSALRHRPKPFTHQAIHTEVSYQGAVFGRMLWIHCRLPAHMQNHRLPGQCRIRHSTVCIVQL